MRFTLGISLALAVLAVVFALQNPGVTNVNVLGFTYAGSKAFILIITFALGVLVGALATFPAYFRNRRKVRSLRKTLAEDRSASQRPQAERPAASSSSSKPPADASSQTT